MVFNRSEHCLRGFSALPMLKAEFTCRVRGDLNLQVRLVNFHPLNEIELRFWGALCPKFTQHFSLRSTDSRCSFRVLYAPNPLNQIPCAQRIGYFNIWKFTVSSQFS